MNNISVCSSRNRRNLLDTSTNFSPMNFSLSNYSTDAQSKAMKDAFGETLLLNNINKLHLISDPLKKNLADSVITASSMEQTKDYVKVEEPPQRSESLTALSGITSFFSGVFNVMSAMFQKRASSPVSQYYDCFEFEDEQQMSPSLAWQAAKFEVQNKSEQVDQFGCNNSTTNLNTSMTTSRNVVSNCEDKLNQVRMLLKDKAQPCKRRPKRVFVEAGSITDSFEDAFCPDDFVNLSNDTFIECYGAYNHQEQELYETDAPYVKTEMCVKESMNIVTNLPDNNYHNYNIEKTKMSDDKDQIVLSCEDKMNKIKELLKSKCKKKDITQCNETKTSPIPIKDVSNDTSFGNEIVNTSIESTNSLPENSFDEVTGKFYSSSADSDDSFQIVFTDTRQRIPSECESEDSFIVFEESPDSCYTSNDVFGNDNDSDSDSELEEDSGYGITTCKLNPTFSRTFGDLTDDSLYSADVVDCAMRAGDEAEDGDASTVAENTGLLLNERKKMEKRKQPPKKVHFSPHPPKVHLMCVWAFAARQARAGHWERHTLDRERFRRRIADIEMAIAWVLKPQHRSRVMFQRFMPWWNAQRRKELEEKALEEQRLKDVEERKNEIVQENDGLKDDEDNNTAKEVLAEEDGKDRNEVQDDKQIESDRNIEENKVKNGVVEEGNDTKDVNEIQDEKQMLDDVGGNEMDIAIESCTQRIQQDVVILDNASGTEIEISQLGNNEGCEEEIENTLGKKEMAIGDNITSLTSSKEQMGKEIHINGFKMQDKNCINETQQKSIYENENENNIETAEDIEESTAKDKKKNKKINGYINGDAQLYQKETELINTENIERKINSNLDSGSQVKINGDINISKNYNITEKHT